MIEVRDAKPDDFRFIVKSWTRSFAHDSFLARMLKPRVYENVMREVIAALSSEPNTRAMIACLSEDPDIIVGFAVYTGSTLHYVYIKEEVRREGIARGMLENIGVDSYSFKTSACMSRLKPVSREWQFRPRFTL